jgi:hypothetical protein
MGGFPSCQICLRGTFDPQLRNGFSKLHDHWHIVSHYNPQVLVGSISVGLIERGLTQQDIFHRSFGEQQKTMLSIEKNGFTLASQSFQIWAGGRYSSPPTWLFLINIFGIRKDHMAIASSHFPP